MSVTYVYKMPLYHAYEYSLASPGAPRPDQLDEEGILHQILTYDGEKRLVKAEQCVNGIITVEKNFFFSGGLISREEEFFHETGARCEVVYQYREGGYSKEFFTEGALEAREVYEKNSVGEAASFRKYDARDNLVEYSEANERGHITRSGDGGLEKKYEYGYRQDGMIEWKKTYDGERETREEFLYNADGALMESITRGGEDETREIFSYDGTRLVKKSIIHNGVPFEYVMYHQEEDGSVTRTETYRGEELVDEYIEKTDPNSRVLVRRHKGKVPVTNDDGEVIRMMLVSTKVEVVRDDTGRVTDILTCDTGFQEPALGITCDPNAYYFLEYEE
jgi:hypothetical protein